MNSREAEQFKEYAPFAEKTPSGSFLFGDFRCDMENLIDTYVYLNLFLVVTTGRTSVYQTRPEVSLPQ